MAYTVCQHCGIDTSDYSFSYVAGWSEVKNAGTESLIDTIRTASEMIATIDEKLKGACVTEDTEQQAVERVCRVS